MIKIHFVVLISLLLTSTLAKRRLVKKEHNDCNDLDLFDDFDVTRFMGLWYEVMSYPYCMTTDAKCVISTYALLSNQNISIYSRFVNARGIENRMIGMAAENSPGRLAVMFSAAPETMFSFYNVLSTNYEDYAIVVACNSLCGRENGLNVWILSRNPSLEPKFVAHALNVLKKNKISLNSLRPTVQDCNFLQMF